MVLRRIGLSQTEISQRQARMDMVALMTARFIEYANGNREPLFEHIQELIKDPERMAGALITVVNLLAAYVSTNGQDMMRFKAFNDYLIRTIREENTTVDKLVIKHGR